MDLLVKPWPHEAISQEGLIAYIRRAVAEALGTVQQSTVSCRVGVVRNVKAIGGGGSSASALLWSHPFGL